MIRMLIVGYVFAIRSERRICAEVRANLAYRFFASSASRTRFPIIRSSAVRGTSTSVRAMPCAECTMMVLKLSASSVACMDKIGIKQCRKANESDRRDAPNFFPRRSAQHSMHCSPNRAPNRALLCLGRPSHPTCAHLLASIPHVMLAQCCAARGAQYARRFLLIRRATTRPSCAQSNVMAPPSCAATVRCTNLLPKPSGIEGATTGGPPRSVHMTTTSSS